MTKQMLTFLLTYLLLTACNQTYTYSIHCCTDETDHEGILFLTEKTTYQSLQDLKDSTALKKYLSPEEYSTAFDTFKVEHGIDSYVQYQTEFIPWDTLLVHENFVAQLVLIKENTENRAYFFQIRTYTKDRQLIGVQPFAIWADNIKRYCSGVFSKEEASFTVTCDRQKTLYTFDKNGQIIPLTF